MFYRIDPCLYRIADRAAADGMSSHFFTGFVSFMNSYCNFLGVKFRPCVFDAAKINRVITGKNLYPVDIL